MTQKPSFNVFKQSKQQAQININLKLVEAHNLPNMKHAPIVNPHARIGQIAKKTKTEEKDELIAATKTQVIEKYGATRTKAKKATMYAGGAMNEAQDDNRGFQLEEKKDK